MDRTKRYTRLLKEETALAVGCTEPIAIALACAKARETLLGEAAEVPDPDRIELALSRNIIKNALGVGIPGTKMTGIPIAAALGYAGGESSRGLEVISAVPPEKIEKAASFVERHLVSISQYEGEENLYIQARVVLGDRSSSVVIRHTHTGIARIERDGKILFEDFTDPEEAGTEPEISTRSLLDIYEFAREAPLEPLKFLLEGARLNKLVALEGLRGAYGLQVGRSIKAGVEKKILSESITTYGVELASGASDARMAGCNLPVLTNSGSGNQGITVSLPVVAAAEKMGLGEEELHRALVMSNLAAIHARKGLDRLTAMCGAFTAGIGASCGIVFLLGGGVARVYRAVQNMVANLTGMVCDGAKDGCALKIASVVEAAFRSALLAMEDISINGDKGINEKDVEKSLRNLVRIGNTGMDDTDRIILDIMVSKDPAAPGPSA